MTDHSTNTGYSFEHGVDHSGYGGVAPILCLGGPITPHDFAERDLTAMRGVSISQRGLPRSTKWTDLNVPFLFSRLQQVEYLRVYFEDQVSLDDLGPLPNLRELVIDCPKVRGTLQGAMPHLRTAHLRWSDKCTAGLLAASLERLTLIRPRLEDLSSISSLTSLQELDIYYAGNLHSLFGLSHLSLLSHLGLHNCPKLTDLSTIEPQGGPVKVVIAGCTRFVDATAAITLGSIGKLCIYAGEKGPTEVRVAAAMRARSIALEVRGITPVWV